ncbi:MAG: EF-P lysine aminoacylase EpmA [Kangiellaceae bacterium]|jgi:lysyl-tRNA synthetase class 2|nr:EF-P lysine aminoacylase EpmA [Kangiellaceae bacterium]
MTQPDWRPSADIGTLQARANILATIRAFFAERGVIEVDTPLMMTHSVTDPYMKALSVSMPPRSYYLQTSPEFAMKRLLAAGMSDIYQLGKCFRADEIGSNHQPEFTMLEWYRKGFDHHQLMEEVAQLVSSITDIKSVAKLSYQQAFQEFIGIDPLAITTESLKLFTEDKLGVMPEDLIRDDYLSFLFAQLIEPKLGHDCIQFIYDYPASQASLAKLNPENSQYAARFEVYLKGIELANGFYELTDASEQYDRFVRDNEQRLASGAKQIVIDDNFIAALEHGLPECSGVALGVDRLIMISLNKNHINEVISFPLMP